MFRLRPIPKITIKCDLCAKDIQAGYFIVIEGPSEMINMQICGTCVGTIKNPHYENE